MRHSESITALAKALAAAQLENGTEDGVMMHRIRAVCFFATVSCFFFVPTHPLACLIVAGAVVVTMLICAVVAVAQALHEGSADGQ